MVMLIEHIDAIARKEQRDVLYVQFHQPTSDEDLKEENVDGLGFFDELDWEHLPRRRQIIGWLDAHGIGWRHCADFANENGIFPYLGQIYIDLPYDPTLPAYKELQAFLENPDDSMRFPDTTFCYVPLEMAMKNAAHDEPGFWEEWAKNF